MRRNAPLVTEVDLTDAYEIIPAQAFRAAAPLALMAGKTIEHGHLAFDLIARVERQPEQFLRAELGKEHSALAVVDGKFRYTGFGISGQATRRLAALEFGKRARL